MNKCVKGYRGVADILIVKAKSIKEKYNKRGNTKIHKERHYLWII